MGMLPIKMSPYSEEVKARYIPSFSFALAVMAFFNSVLYYVVYKSVDLAMICVICAALALLVPLLRKITSSHLLITNYVVAVFFTCVSFLAVYTGGILSNAIWWLGGVPLVASFLMNAFYGLSWFIVIILDFLIIFFAEKYGLLPLNILEAASPEGRVIVSFTLNSTLIASLCILADLIRDQAFLEKEELRLKTFQLNQMASLGKMASGVAHEINNPLTVIRGAQMRITRMIESPEPIDKTLLADYMAKAQRNILRIQDVTGLLGTISEKARDRTMSEINIKRMLDDVIQMRTEDLHKYNITLEKHFPDNPVVFKGIFTEIFQAFLTLFENAIFELKNSPAGERSLHLNLMAESRRIVVLIEDNGQGIPTEQRQHIFDPFFKAKNPEDAKGMGLSFSFNVFNTNGGTLELLNSASGSLFRVTLPIK